MYVSAASSCFIASTVVGASGRSKERLTWQVTTEAPTIG